LKEFIVLGGRSGIQGLFFSLPKALGLLVPLSPLDHLYILIRFFSAGSKNDFLVKVQYLILPQRLQGGSWHASNILGFARGQNYPADFLF